MSTTYSHSRAPQPTEAQTLDELFRLRVAATPDAVAYRHFDHHRNQWQSLSWREMAEAVSYWQTALAAEGLQPGKRVAIALRNGPEWVIFDQAALALGLVVVPLYPEDRPDNIAYCLNDCGARLLLLQDLGRWQRAASALAEVPTLKRIIITEGAALPTDDKRTTLLEQWLNPDAPPTHSSAIQQPDSLATIAYTSGTVGRPKGVMLSHRNILSVTRSGLGAVEVKSTDCFLSFLPLSHMYERTVGYYLPMMAGSQVAFSRSANQLIDDLNEISPTILITVPRLLERVYNRIEQGLTKSNSLTRLLYRLAIHCGWQRFEWQQGRRGWHPTLLIEPLLQQIVGSKIRRKFGQRLRLIVSGGAALPFPIARTFIALHLPILQGYGLSETSPQVCVNRRIDNEPRSVGRALEGTELRTDERGELLVRGDCVMLGYWNNPPATAAAIDGEGWFHTGDQATIVNGRIYISGRLKEIIVLINGEKVPPADMESAIALDPLFEQVVIVGEHRAYLSALLVLNEELWQQLALKYALDPANEASLHHRTIQREVLNRINCQLHDFPGYAKVRRVHLTLTPWTMENDLMTATMKLRRSKVSDFYRKEIEAMYQVKSR